MPCTSSTSNVLDCGGLSRSDCEIYEPRSIARQISDVFNAMIRCNKKCPGRSYSRIKLKLGCFHFRRTRFLCMNFMENSTYS